MVVSGVIELTVAKCLAIMKNILFEGQFLHSVTIYFLNYLLDDQCFKRCPFWYSYITHILSKE